MWDSRHVMDKKLKLLNFLFGNKKKMVMILKEMGEMKGKIKKEKKKICD